MVKRKTLGRCARRHAQVVEYTDGEMPSGVCSKCGGDTPLIEWALRVPAKESSR